MPALRVDAQMIQVRPRPPLRRLGVGRAIAAVGPLGMLRIANGDPLAAEGAEVDPLPAPARERVRAQLGGPMGAMLTTLCAGHGRDLRRRDDLTPGAARATTLQGPQVLLAGLPRAAPRLAPNDDQDEQGAAADPVRGGAALHSRRRAWMDLRLPDAEAPI